MVLTLAAACTFISLSQTGNASFEAHKKGAALLIIVGVHLILGHATLVETPIVVGKDGGNVEAVGAGHAIFAVGAVDILEAHLAFGNIHEHASIVVGEGLQGRICAYIILQMLHIGHSAEHRQHIVVVALYYPADAPYRSFR